MATTDRNTEYRKRVEYFKQHYATMTGRDIAAALGVSMSTVGRIAQNHNLRKTAEHKAETYRRSQLAKGHWNEALIDLLALMYPVMTLQQVADLLGVSVKSVRRMAAIKGLVRQLDESPAEQPEKPKQHTAAPPKAQHPKLPPPMTPAQLARRDKERIRLTDYKTIPHINGAMRALYRGTELHHRGLTA